ncbi:hypothetical protein [Streptomyces sp. NPDC095602]|uniref:hypothetical protein n=1 Tax=Streptomyces sp. NPDC095602 TaxID=3155819 RepID=UPI00331D4C77
MTTPLATARPTPLDLARRAAARNTAPVPARAAAPESTFLERWHRGVLDSSVIPTHRLVALALATYADPAGRIRRQPFLTGLVNDTRLRPAQVAVALTALLERGWVRRAARDRRRSYELSPLQLAIPSSATTRERDAR